MNTPRAFGSPLARSTKDAFDHPVAIRPEGTCVMRATVFAALAVILATSGAAQEGGATGGREEFTAVALSVGGPRSDAVAGQVDIVIERWSTEAERERLFGTLGDGQKAMLDTLRELPSIGFVRTPGTLGWDLRYAHQVADEDGGRRIFIATDRPISMWEAINRPPTIDYPFTFIELRVNSRGEGEGKLSRATQVIASKDGRFVHIENWETQPVALTQVKHRR
jgi:hypothetical protein